MSDSSEQFVLLSGLALGSVFSLKSARDGFARALSDLWQRLRRLYVIHLGAVAAFGALVIWAEACGLAPGEVDRLHWRWLVEMPFAAIPDILLMLYQPEFTGILPLFIWCMALLPAFLWLCGRAGGWALAPPAALYAAVQILGLQVPGPGGTAVAYNPFAWQLMFLIGAWCGRQALLAGRAVPPHRALTATSCAVLALGLWARLVGHGWLPDIGIGPWLIEGKADLAPPRLLHALALAWLVAQLVPRDRPWMHGPAGAALASVGRNSLEVFCLGLLLSWGATVALRLHPGAAAWLDALLIPAGITLVVGFARLLQHGGATRHATVGRAG